MNLLYIIFMHLFAQILLVLAGFTVRSAFSHLGSNRELLAIVAYEPIMLLIAVGFYLQVGSFEVSEIMQSGETTLSYVGLLIAFIMILPIRLKKSPFDGVDAHQEIVGGAEIEYSGAIYEMLYMAKLLEYVFVFSFLALFSSSIISALIFMIVIFVLINIIDNKTARVNMGTTIKIIYLTALPLAVINLLWIAYV
jgi:ech hydrogenase subunit B